MVNGTSTVTMKDGPANQIPTSITKQQILTNMLNIPVLKNLHVVELVD